MGVLLSGKRDWWVGFSGGVDLVWMVWRGWCGGC